MSDMSDALVNAYKKVLATTKETWLDSTIHDLITGVEEGRPPETQSPFLQMMGKEAKDTISAGGSMLNWTGRVARPNSYFVNPVKPYPSSDDGDSLRKFQVNWAVIKTPITIFEISKILNAGSARACDLIKDDIRACFMSQHALIAQAVIGNGTTRYDGLSNPKAYQSPASYLTTMPLAVPDAMKMYGLGFGNDTTNGAHLSTSNTFAGQDRSLASNIRLRAACLDVTSSTDMGSLAIAAGEISKLTLAHVRLLNTVTSLSGVTPTMNLVGTEVFDQLRNEADAKGMLIDSNIDKTLLSLGHLNYKQDGIPIVCDKFFAYPLQIVAVNTRNTRLIFCAGKEPSMSTSIWRPELGDQAMWQEVTSYAQLYSKNPGGVGVLYGLTRG